MKKMNEKNDLEILLKNLKKIFNYYLDDNEDNFLIYSLWTIGTEFHSQFLTYPYLFINAMRGSGKSRLLRLLAFLGNGIWTSSLTESVMFRTNGLLCLDEAEHLHSKDKQALRELLNASYKKGLKIIRMEKIKNGKEEKFEAKYFELYRPIVIANIYGMEEILGDRCITRILEKSMNPSKTKIIEDFENDKLIIKSKELMKKLKDNGQLKIPKNIFQEWNCYIKNKYENKNDCDNEFFNLIDKTKLNGRNLELFLPIIIIAKQINEDTYKETLKIANQISEEKLDEESFESIDVLIYEFISTYNITPEGFTSLTKLCNEFKIQFEIYEEWSNPRWFGRRLKSLKLIKEKRRTGKGIEIMIDKIKAQKQIKLFPRKESTKN